jgi:hypothetical protein
MTNNQPNKKKTTLDDLANMMQSGFKEIRSDVAAHDHKFDELIRVQPRYSHMPHAALNHQNRT